MNARTELLEHIAGRPVIYVHILLGLDYGPKPQKIISGSLQEVLPQLDVEYDDGFGGQELFGNIWYADGTWSERGEYDGSEWWEHKERPDLPPEAPQHLR